MAGGVQVRPLNRDRWSDLVELFRRPGASIARHCWCMYRPSRDYPRLDRSPIMKPVDEAPVWSIVCFFVDARERGQGVTRALLRGAMAYARSQGATLVEAYPVDKRDRSHPNSMWHGPKRLYDEAGFTEVARRKATRPVVRRRLRPRV